MILEGKKIAFLGDSITEGVGVTDRIHNRYDNILKRACKLAETFNYGIGGTRLAHQSEPSEKPRYDLCFAGRAYDIDKSADIIVVYGGINDYIHGDACIGEWGDSTPKTFYGAVRFLMKFLKEHHEGKTIVFMTPAHCHFGGVSDSVVSPRPMKKPCAMPVRGYVDIILRTGEDLGIPVLNLYDNLGIDPNNPEDKEKYTVDGLHFNDAGHVFIAARLRDFLLSL